MSFPKEETRPLTVLVVTPGLKGGSWTRLRDVIRIGAPRLKAVVVGYGNRPDGLPSTCRVIPVRFLDYASKTYLPYHPFISVLFSLPLAAIAALWFLITRPRVVLANGLILGFCMLPLTVLFRRRLIVSHHGWIQHNVDGVAAHLTGMLSRAIDLIVVNSTGSKKDLARIVRHGNMLISEHYADPEFFRDVPRVRKWRDLDWGRRFVVAYVGRIDQEKGVDTLLTAIPDVLAEREDDVFVFCGEGTLGGALHRLQARFPKNIVIPGYVQSQVELATLYRSANVVWSYADETYLARPAVESLACGTPIIVVDRPAILRKKALSEARVSSELVPPTIGCIVETGNGHAAARVLLDWPGIGELASHGAIRRYALQRYSIENLNVMVDALARSS